jgi:hypothetical protein
MFENNLDVSDRSTGGRSVGLMSSERMETQVKVNVCGRSDREG